MPKAASRPFFSAITESGDVTPCRCRRLFFPSQLALLFRRLDPQLDERVLALVHELSSANLA
ncbi:hypothetical protein [Paludibacterium denitrificans]|uniref:hypothetical protein n=1 Tax=Paludibacterium denitrificans TaxID=2675226 RepID=UPI001E29E92E|nr:hypothetical protein [Paludibacterium denitrificans]